MTAGCTTSQIADNAALANRLIDLRIQYDSTADAVDAVIDRLPTETGLELLELREEADAYVKRIMAAWEASPGLTLAQMERYYQEGRRLYQRGYDLIAPIAGALPADTVAALAALHAKAASLDAQIRETLSQDAETRRMIAAGLELATLALKIGMLAL